MINDQTMRIGRAAELAGVAIDTIRYYERLGLLPKAPRTSSGYRIYAPEAVQRLRFIKRAQAFGFSLAEIKEILNLNSSSRSSCARVLQMIDRKLEQLESKMAEMKKLKKELSTYRSACRRALRTGSACPVIEDTWRGRKRH